MRIDWNHILCSAVAIVIGQSLMAQRWQLAAAAGFAVDGSAMVFDSTNGRTVLFGGADSTGHLANDTIGFDGSNWHVLAATGPTPQARTRFALAFDSVRGRTVLFGGSPDYQPQLGGGLGDTWEFDGAVWAQIATANAPSGRVGHCMCYDSLRARTVLFSGGNLAATPDDTWEYDGIGWAQVVTAQRPPARYDGCLAFDTARGRTVLFGGLSQGVFPAQTWEFDGNNWLSIATATTPTPRIQAAMAYDSARQRIVLFGGFPQNTGATASDETWDYDGVTWTLRTTSNTPVRRGRPAMAFDSLRQRTVLRGGATGTTLDPLCDTWTFDGTNWTQAIAHSEPPATHSRGTTYDPVRRRFVQFGGSSPQGYVAQTLEFDDSGWRLVPTVGAPSPRAFPRLTFDRARQRTVLFGGVDQIGQTPVDTWFFDGVAWTPAASLQTPPPRYEHGLVYDSVRDRVVMHAGRNGNGFLVDTWEFDGTQWTEHTNTQFLPPPRWAHAMAYDLRRQLVVLFGGTSGGAALGDTWEYDGIGWRTHAVGAPPAPRSSAAMAYDELRGQIVLFGGLVNPTTFGAADTWSYDGTWHAIPIATPPAPRDLHALEFDHGTQRLLLLGPNENAARTLPLPNAAWSEHGSGCTVGLLAPRLAAAPGSTPALGTTFTMNLTSLPAPGAAILLLGFDFVQWNGTPLPTLLPTLGLPQCRFWIAPVPGYAQLLPHTTGATSASLTIPAAAVLAGITLGAQALVLDAAATNGFVASTNAGILQVR